MSALSAGLCGSHHNAPGHIRRAAQCSAICISLNLQATHTAMQGRYADRLEGLLPQSLGSVHAAYRYRYRVPWLSLQHTHNKSSQPNLMSGPYRCHPTDSVLPIHAAQRHALITRVQAQTPAFGPAHTLNSQLHGCVQVPLYAHSQSHIWCLNNPGYIADSKQIYCVTRGTQHVSQMYVKKSQV